LRDAWGRGVEVPVDRGAADAEQLGDFLDGEFAGVVEGELLVTT